MLDLKSLTNEELVSYCVARDSLTVLEAELYLRLENELDVSDALLQQVTELENEINRALKDNGALRDQVVELEYSLSEYMR